MVKGVHAFVRPELREPLLRWSRASGIEVTFGGAPLSEPWAPALGLRDPGQVIYAELTCLSLAHLLVVDLEGPGEWRFCLGYWKGAYGRSVLGYGKYVPGDVLSAACTHRADTPELLVHRLDVHFLRASA